MQFQISRARHGGNNNCVNYYVDIILIWLLNREVVQRVDRVWWSSLRGTRPSYYSAYELGTDTRRMQVFVFSGPEYLFWKNIFLRTFL